MAPRGGSIKTKCGYCKCVIYRSPSDFKGAKHLYCCREHYGLHVTQLRAKKAARSIKHRNCLQCGTPLVHEYKCSDGYTKIDTKKKFCGHSCAGLYSRENARARAKWDKAIKESNLMRSQVSAEEARRIEEARRARDSYLPVNEFATEWQAFD